MVRRTLLPCRHRGCAALVRRPGYCELHTGEEVGWRSDRERGDRHQRGYGTAWNRLRELVLKRGRHLCQCHECKQTGRMMEGRTPAQMFDAGKTQQPDPQDVFAEAA